MSFIYKLIYSFQYKFESKFPWNYLQNWPTDSTIYMDIQRNMDSQDEITRRQLLEELHYSL